MCEDFVILSSVTAADWVLSGNGAPCPEKPALIILKRPSWVSSGPRPHKDNCVSAWISMRCITHLFKMNTRKNEKEKIKWFFWLMNAVIWEAALCDLKLVKVLWDDEYIVLWWTCLCETVGFFENEQHEAKCPIIESDLWPQKPGDLGCSWKSSSG